MKQLWAGWKVALLWLGIGLGVLGVVAGVVGAMTTTGDPEAVGEEIGTMFAVPTVAAPIIAYIVQKMRIDHANRPAARRAQREREQQPPTA